MPRHPRRDRDGELHHVVIRGHNGRPLFTCAHDANLFLSGLAERFEDNDVRTFGWSGVTNHFHVMPRGRIEPIATALRDATSHYARRMNHRTGERGSFFQGRFWSKPIHDEGYARTGIVYVIRNSLTAGHVQSADDLWRHPLCGGAPLMRDDAVQRLPMDVDGALTLFGPDRATARRALADQMEAGVEQWERDRRDPSIEAIVRCVAAERGVPPEVLRSGSRHGWISEGRIEVVRRAVAIGLSLSSIARALGVSRQSVARVAKKLAAGPEVRREDGWTARFVAERVSTYGLSPSYRVISR